MRRDFLCMDMTPPADLTNTSGAEIIGLPTTRNTVARNTSGSACVGCHSNFINPLGFALENFDGFGKYRTHEPIYDQNGNVTQTLPIDPVVQPKFNVSDRTTTTTDPLSFSRELGDSPEFNACFVRHYFRYSQARQESLTSDGCGLQRMMSSLTDPDTGSIQNMIKSVAKDPSFRRRPFTP